MKKISNDEAYQRLKDAYLNKQIISQSCSSVFERTQDEEIIKLKREKEEMRLALTKENEALEEQNKELKSEIEEHSSTIASMTIENENLLKQLTALNMQLSNLQEERNLLSESNKNHIKNLEEAKHTIDSLQEKLQQKEIKGLGLDDGVKHNKELLTTQPEWDPKEFEQRRKITEVIRKEIPAIATELFKLAIPILCSPPLPDKLADCIKEQQLIIKDLFYLVFYLIDHFLAQDADKQNTVEIFTRLEALLSTSARFKDIGSNMKNIAEQIKAVYVPQPAPALSGVQVERRPMTDEEIKSPSHSAFVLPQKGATKIKKMECMHCHAKEFTGSGNRSIAVLSEAKKKYYAHQHSCHYIKLIEGALADHIWYCQPETKMAFLSLVESVNPATKDFLVEKRKPSPS